MKIVVTIILVIMLRNNYFIKYSSINYNKFNKKFSYINDFDSFV